MVKNYRIVIYNFSVGWYNIESGQRFSWRRGRSNVTSIDIPPGLYGFDKLQSIIASEPFGSLTINKENGLINLTIANQHEVRINRWITQSTRFR